MKTYNLVTTNQPLEIGVRSGNQLWLVPAVHGFDAHSRTVLIVTPLGDGVCWRIALGKWSGMYIRMEYTDTLATDVPEELIQKVLREDNTALVRTKVDTHLLDETLILVPCTTDSDAKLPKGALLVALFDRLRPEFFLVQTGAGQGCVIRNTYLETLLS